MGFVISNWALLAGLGLLLGLVLFWELYISEGAHLGRRFVTWLYDVTAVRYNGIKGFDRAWEIRFLGEPVAQVLGSMRQPRVLDVGAGTGRLAWALEGSHRFLGRVVCLERSRAMVGQQLPTAGGVGRDWLQAWAAELPFDGNCFDLTACLEVLEFTPDPAACLAEFVRVLRPGGWLLVSNRIGWQAPLILGRTFNGDRFSQALRDAGLVDVEIFPWQMDYDLAWARKPLASEIQEASTRAARTLPQAE